MRHRARPDTCARVCQVAPTQLCPWGRVAPSLSLGSLGTQDRAWRQEPEPEARPPPAGPSSEAG